MRSWSSAVTVGFCLLLAPSMANAETIYGCKQKIGGALRIVGAQKVCLKSETKMSWNSEGPQGEPGIQGDPGVPGEPGARGTKILAYDDNDQFLGAAVSSLKRGDGQNHYLTLIVPSVPGFVPIDEIEGKIPSLYMYWDGPGCTGTAYGITNLNIFSCFATKHCVGDAPIVTTALQSFSYTADPAECQTTIIPPAKRFTIKEVQLPFTVPVTVPMHIEVLP